MLASLLLLTAAEAKKIPVTVNVGIGPTLSAVGSPSGGMLTAAGLSLQVEGWVSRKTLRSKAVKKRVPKQYRSMLNSMDDLHVVPLPLWVVPDTAWLASLDEDAPALRGASWAPWSMHLFHKVGAPHVSVAVAPRVSWLRLSEGSAEPENHPWLGLSLEPEVQTKMRKQVGVAVGGSLGAGYAPEISGYGIDGRPWLHASGSVRLQVRVPIKVKL